MENNKTLLIGGGGHCHSVLDSLLQAISPENLGIVALPGDKGKLVFGVPVVGCDDDLRRLHHNGWSQAVVALGSIGNVSKRERMFCLIQKIGFSLPTIIDPTAMIARNIKMDPGVFVGKGAVLNSGAEVGKGAIINTGAIVEHDCKIGSLVHIASGAVLCGNVQVGEGGHIGAGSTVIQGVSIGNHALIGAGSVVLTDIPPNVISYGNPCRVIRNRV